MTTDRREFDLLDKALLTVGGLLTLARAVTFLLTPAFFCAAVILGGQEAIVDRGWLTASLLIGVGYIVSTVLFGTLTWVHDRKLRHA